jgi:uncharacterized protein (TIGR00730 family)
MSKIQSICVYCGSSSGRDPAYARGAEALGRSIARHGLSLTYGGGAKGIMGAVSRAVLENGGDALGVIPEFLISREAAGARIGALPRLIVTDNMHQRKHALFENADAFVALPGGIGTLEEIVEIMTWAQLGQHQKPMVFANVKGFWNPMLELMEHMRAEGFIHSGHLMRPLVIEDVEEIVPAILREGAKTEPPGKAPLLEKL